MNREVFSVFFNRKPLNFTKSMSFKGDFRQWKDLLRIGD